MTKLNIAQLIEAMIKAAGEAVNKKWKGLSETWDDARGYAESEFKKILEAIVFIEKEVSAGRMTKKRAKMHLTMQKNSAEMVLLTIEGIGIIAVEGLINAALGAVKETINKALKFSLL
jgi:hypothetical protein